MNKPDFAIKQANPKVFRETVFPPVLGPVIIRVSNLVEKVKNGDIIIINGETGEIIIKVSNIGKIELEMPEY